jgi:hypothetical protein
MRTIYTDTILNEDTFISLASGAASSQYNQTLSDYISDYPESIDNKIIPYDVVFYLRLNGEII